MSRISCPAGSGTLVGKESYPVGLREKSQSYADWSLVLSLPINHSWLLWCCSPLTSHLWAMCPSLQLMGRRRRIKPFQTRRNSIQWKERLRGQNSRCPLRGSHTHTSKISSFVSFFFLTSLLEYNCFTMLC